MGTEEFKESGMPSSHEAVLLRSLHLRRQKPLRRLTAAAVSTVVTVTLLGQASAYGVPWAGDWEPPTPPEVTGINVTDLPAGKAFATGSRDKATTKPAKVSWPAAGRARVALPASARGSAAPGRVKAGGMPVNVGAPAGGRVNAADTVAAPGAVRVQLAERQTTVRAGVHGLLLSVARDDSMRAMDADTGAADTAVIVEIDYSGFAGAYGGDWSSRLQITRVVDCGISDLKAGGKCSRAETLESVNDPTTRTVSAVVPLSGGNMTMLAVSAGAAGANGDHTATSLSPSGSWQVSAQTGGFSWSYPLRMVPGVNGPVPSLGMSYSSQAMDGRTGNTNNQGSWIGDGWDMWPGYVERQYQTCSQDMEPVAGQSPNNIYPTPDSCWFSDNATMSLNGRSTELVKSADGTWKGVSDDGSRIERIYDTSLGNGDADGEYWKVTTTDGTQYFFGRHRRDGYPSDNAATDSTWLVPVYGNHPGEPGYASGNFSGSRQNQAWRWNLDYVVDTSDNTMTLFYGKETGAYGREFDANLRTTYDRGGYLKRIEYGTRKSTEHTAVVPARVVFDVADRCFAGVPCDFSHPESWPDTPIDQYCAAAPCTDQTAPTFWTQKRLAKIRTQVWRGSGFADVESWTLRQDYLDAGASDGEGVPMWLSGITRTGHVTTAGGAQITEPEVVFDPGPSPLANRVDGPSDGKTKLNRWRINRIWTESGSIVIVNYKTPECTSTSLPQPESNTKRCYPQWYGPNGMESTLDWFHKYVVESVFVDDNTGASTRIETYYDYLENPAWHYADSELVKEDKRTWSQWRGYSKVRVRQGDPAGTQSSVEYLYLRGMDGGRATPSGGTKSVQIVDSQGGSIADHEAHAGFLREQTTRNGVGGAVVSGSISTPWRRQTASLGILTAWRTQTETTRSYTVLESGQKRWTKTNSSFDPVYGMPSQVDNLGDESTSDDDRCMRYEYARNVGDWIVAKVSRSTIYAMKCASVPANPGEADVLSDSRTYYDDPDAFGATPSRGLIVKNQQVDSWSAGAPVWVTTGRAKHDVHGRITEAYDALDYKTTTAFSPTVGGPVVSKAVTNAFGQSATTTLEPAWGDAVRIVDANGRKTEMTYNGFGHVRQVWLPGRDKATQGPNYEFEYLVRNNAPTAVTTRSLLPVGGAYLTSITLFDGSLRERQIQTQAPGGGRTITDMSYDSRGLTTWQSKPYYDASHNPPSTALVGPAGQVQIPGITESEYDGVGRLTATIFKAQGVEQWRATTAYGGDRIHVTPPAGGTATTKISDALGRKVALRQYHGTAPSGTYDETAYSYTRRGELERVTDPADNAWSWSYDQRGQQKTANDPDSGTTTFTYDNANQMRTSTDGRGVTLGYTYDALGRKTSVRDGSLTGPIRTEWIYDTLPGGAGMLTKSIRYEGSAAYTTEVVGYDAAGRPTGSKVTIPASESGLAGTYETAMTYQPDGSLYSMTFPAAGGLPSEMVGYAYNDVGMQTSIVSGMAIYVYAVSYDKLGQLTQRVLGNYGKRTFVTNTFDEPTGRLVNTSGSPEGGLEIMDLAYKYDPAGNLTRIADSPGAALPSDTQCYRYDYLRRLTQAWTPTSKTETNCDPNPQFLGGPAKYRQDFEYDLSGNRTKLTEYTTSAPSATTTYDYPAPGGVRPHTMSSATRVDGSGQTVSTFDYDNVGNTTQRVIGGDSQSLTWDNEGRIRQITGGNGNTRLIYDADGNRLIRRDPTGSTLYLAGQEVRYNSSTGVTSCTRYYNHLGTTIAVREGQDNQNLFWTVTDHHGTGEAMIRASDLSVARKRTKPFGETRGTPPSTWAGDKGFVGGTEDPTGLVHLGARLYDQLVGRFISDDPVTDTADPQQLNGYAYANNNPASFSDPSGLYFTEDNEDTGARGFATTDSSGNTTIKVVDKFVPPPCDAKCQAERERLRQLERERMERERKERQARERCQADWFCRAGQAINNFNNAALDWATEHADIVGAVAGVVVGVACTALTGGGGALVCGAIGGAVSGLVSGALKCRGGDDAHCGAGLAKDMGLGALSGLAAGGAGVAIGGAVRAGAPGAIQAFNAAAKGVPGAFRQMGARNVGQFMTGSAKNFATDAARMGGGARGWTAVMTDTAGMIGRGALSPMGIGAGAAGGVASGLTGVSADTIMINTIGGMFGGGFR